MNGVRRAVPACINFAPSRAPSLRPLIEARIHSSSADGRVAVRQAETKPLFEDLKPC